MNEVEDEREEEQDPFCEDHDRARGRGLCLGWRRSPQCSGYIVRSQGEARSTHFLTEIQPGLRPDVDRTTSPDRNIAIRVHHRPQNLRGSLISLETLKCGAGGWMGVSVTTVPVVGWSSVVVIGWEAARECTAPSGKIK